MAGVKIISCIIEKYFVAKLGYDATMLVSFVLDFVLAASEVGMMIEYNQWALPCLVTVNYLQEKQYEH